MKILLLLVIVALSLSGCRTQEIAASPPPITPKPVDHNIYVTRSHANIQTQPPPVKVVKPEQEKPKVETPTKAEEERSDPPTFPDNYFVYRSENGASYHVKNCDRLNGLKIYPISIEEANRRGLSSCRYCMHQKSRELDDSDYRP